MVEPVSLTVAYAERAKLQTELTARRKEFEDWEKVAQAKVSVWNEVIQQHKSGLDASKVALARTVLLVGGKYANAGAERGSVISDAISWFATGKAPCYYQLTSANYGTKNYDRWQGQRSDHEWGGPSHGSLVFQIGLKDRKAEITDEQREACLYFLSNIVEIEQAAELAKAA